MLVLCVDKADFDKLFGHVTNLAGILTSSLIIYIVYSTTSFLSKLNLGVMIEKEPASAAIYVLFVAVILLYVLYKTAVMLFKLGGNRNGN